MQQVATVSSTGAAVTYDNGIFAVGGEAIGIAKVMEYDKLGVLRWVSEETRAWAHQVAYPAPLVPQPAAFAQPMGTTTMPKKPWYKKWWVWVAGVLILSAISNAAGGVSRSTDSASVPGAPAVSAPVEQPAAVPAPAPAPAPAADPTAKMGQPLKVGDLVFTVSGATATTQLKSVLGNKSGNWVLITVTVKNESKKAVTTDSSFFKLLSADGSAYETDSDSLMYLSGDQSLFLEKINPNLSKTGQVLFAVPAGVNPQDFTLQVQTGFWGTQTGGIALTE